MTDVITVEVGDEPDRRGVVVSVSGSHPDRGPGVPIADRPARAGATNTPDPHPSTPETSQPGTEATRARDALARVLDPVAYDPKIVTENVGQEWDRTNRQMEAMAHARAALAAGYRPAPTLDGALVDLITADDDESWSIPTRPHAEAIADRILAAGYRLVSGDETNRHLDHALKLLDRYSQLGMGGTPDLFSPDCWHMATGTVSHDPWDCMESQVSALRSLRGEQS